jgi:CRISPR/Cas system CSM-associated protein Csm2 small subunit
VAYDVHYRKGPVTAVMRQICYTAISYRIDHYKIWNERIIDTRMKTQKGQLTILEVKGLREGKDELNEEFYEILQKLLDKVNKKIT